MHGGSLGEFVGGSVGGSVGDVVGESVGGCGCATIASVGDDVGGKEFGGASSRLRIQQRHLALVSMLAVTGHHSRR